MCIEYEDEEEEIMELKNKITFLEMHKEDLLKELDKKDKVIDLMARAINNYDSQLVINYFSNKDDVRQCFYKKVEEEK